MDIARQYLRQLNESIDMHNDSIKNWKEVAKALTDAGEKWIQNSGNYDIYSDKIGFGFTCGEEDGIWEFFSSVGAEVKEFSSKQKLLKFINKIGLPLEGLSDEEQSSGWEGDGYYFRYDLDGGYLKILVTSLDVTVTYYPSSYELESKEIELARNATDEEIKSAIEQIASEIGLDENRIDEITSTCPLDKLKR